MHLSKQIGKTLADGEKVEKCFTFGHRHLNIRLAISLVKWLFISAAVGVLIVLIYKVSEAANRELLMPLFEQGKDGLKIAGEPIAKSFLPMAGTIAGLIFLLIIAPISFFYHLYYLKEANTFVFSDRRVIVKRGWLNTKIKSIYYDRITDVSVTQSFIDKVIHATGTLSISTAGSDGYEVELNCVHHPHDLKKQLYELKEAYRNKTYPTAEALKREVAID